MLRKAAKMHEAECSSNGDRTGELHRAMIGPLGKAILRCLIRLLEAAGAQTNCLHRPVGITSVSANLGTGHALKI